MEGHKGECQRLFLVEGQGEEIQRLFPVKGAEPAAGPAADGHSDAVVIEHHSSLLQLYVLASLAALGATGSKWEPTGSPWQQWKHRP